MTTDLVASEIEALRPRFASITVAPLQGTQERLVVVPDYPCPAWSAATARVAVRVPVQYPDQRLDLIFIDPDIAPPGGGGASRSMGVVVLNGQTWRQISWHFGGRYDPARQNLVAFVHSITNYFAGRAV